MRRVSAVTLQRLLCMGFSLTLTLLWGCEPSGSNEPTSSESAGVEALDADSEIDVYHFEHELGRSLAGMSDQRSYWIFDIPALMINDTSFLRNPNYHEMSDDIDTLNFDKMAQVIHSMIRCLGRLK